MILLALLGHFYLLAIITNKSQSNTRRPHIFSWKKNIACHVKSHFVSTLGKLKGSSEFTFDRMV